MHEESLKFASTDNEPLRRLADGDIPPAREEMIEVVSEIVNTLVSSMLASTPRPCHDVLLSCLASNALSAMAQKFGPQKTGEFVDQLQAWVKSPAHQAASAKAS